MSSRGCSATTTYWPAAMEMSDRKSGEQGERADQTDGRVRNRIDRRCAGECSASRERVSAKIEVTLSRIANALLLPSPALPPQSFKCTVRDSRHDLIEELYATAAPENG